MVRSVLSVSDPSTRRSWLRVQLIDVLIAVVAGFVCYWGTLGAWQNQPTRVEPDTAALVLIVIAAAGIALRRTVPWAAVAATAVASCVYMGLGYPYGPILFLLFAALYRIATLTPFRTALVTDLVVLVAFGLVTFISNHARETGESGQSFFNLGWLAWLLIPAFLGIFVRTRREAAKYNKEEIARRKEEEDQRKIYEERLRIAQEVHDVVGHGLSVITMQAGVALHVVDRRPEQARVALEAIRTTSKHALDDLRRAIGVFRETDESSATRRPAPGLSRIQDLVDSVVHSGLPVSVEVTGEPVDLPAAVDLAAYRIIQESLTNVLRHAGQASATVHISYADSAVELDITDDGAGGVSTTGGGGFGIGGMRERARAIGGTLDAGPRADGGFGVHARLPLGEGSE